MIGDSRRFSIEKYWELCARINPDITGVVIYLQTRGLFFCLFVCFQYLYFEDFQEFKFATSIAICYLLQGASYLLKSSNLPHCIVYSSGSAFKGLLSSGSKRWYWHIATMIFQSLGLIWTFPTLNLSCEELVLTHSAFIIHQYWSSLKITKQLQQKNQNQLIETSRYFKNKYKNIITNGFFTL